MSVAKQVAWLLVPLVLALFGGCSSLDDGDPITSESLLKAATPSPQSVTLDVYWARFAWGNEELNANLWNQVQEDRLAVDVRTRLAANGLRAGVIGGTPPQALARLLSPDSTGDEAESDSQATTPLVDRPQVKRRTIQLAPGQEKTLSATEVLPEATLFIRRNGELSGRTYSQAEGLYSLTTANRSGSRVRLMLTPELRHGQPQIKWQRTQPGVMAQSVARETVTFDDLRTYVELAPGEMLIVLNLPEAACRLGELLHTDEGEGRREQQMLIVRLSQSPPTDAILADSSDAWAK